MGRTARTRKRAFGRKLVRLCNRARPKPSSVVVRPVATARVRLFQTTPHRVPSVMQASFQISAISETGSKCGERKETIGIQRRRRENFGNREEYEGDD